MTNRKLTTGFPTSYRWSAYVTPKSMGFPMSYQPRSCITPNFPKMGFKYPSLWFFTEISTKNH